MTDYVLTPKAVACLKEAKDAINVLTQYKGGGIFIGPTPSELSAYANNGSNSREIAYGAEASKIVHDEVYKPCMDGEPTFTSIPKVTLEPTNSR